MEELERYIIGKGENISIVDNDQKVIFNITTKKLQDLLNQQNKRIKELETTNKVLSNELTKNNIMKQDKLETCCGIPIYEIPALKEENQQLKQQLAEKEKEIEQVTSKLPASYDKEQNQKAIEQLEKVKEFLINSVAWWGYKCDGVSPTEFIDNQIKELKGEE